MDLVQDRQGVIPAIVRGGYIGAGAGGTGTMGGGGDNDGLCIKVSLPYDLASGN